MAVQGGAGPIDRRLLHFRQGFQAFESCFVRMNANFDVSPGVACGGAGLYTAPWFRAGLGWLALEPYITGHGDTAA